LGNRDQARLAGPKNRGEPTILPWMADCRLPLRCSCSGAAWNQGMGFL